MELYQFFKKYLQGHNFVDLLVPTKAIILGSHEFWWNISIFIKSISVKIPALILVRVWRSATNSVHSCRWSLIHSAAHVLINIWLWRLYSISISLTMLVEPRVLPASSTTNYINTSMCTIQAVCIEMGQTWNGSETQLQTVWRLFVHNDIKSNSN